jgi:hypothetical protein
LALRHHFFQFLYIPSGQAEPGTLSGKLQCQLTPDPGGGAGNDDYVFIKRIIIHNK